MAAIKALVKPDLLAWTRQRARVKIEDAAKALNVDVDRIEKWETGTEAPTINQLRALAKKYHFPLAVFYLPEPPADFAPLRDFRRLPEFTDQAISANLAFHIRNANERRELALELHDDLGTQPKPFPLSATLDDDPEELGQAIRRFLNINEQSQRKAARDRRAFDFWRRKMEEQDLLVFVVGGPHYSVSLREMRGFAISRTTLPVIVINGKDTSQGGKSFTLLHELVHILLGESAISNGASEELDRSPQEQRIERFCDAVAAAALMPKELIWGFPEAAGQSPRKWRDDELRTISKAIGVSRHALLLRFVALKRATWEFYKTQRERFEEESRRAAEKKDEKPEIKIKRPILLMSWNGRSYTRLVLRSYYDQRITLNDVSSYLGAKLKHIPALEHAAFHGAE
jgi:Zn-dependent peptidase ImmA (M78 family)/DNA-binding XRE family transcriptional regulator